MKDLFETICAIAICIFVVMYVIAFVQNSIGTTRNIIDVMQNGSPRFKEGYIPVKQRKYPDVKVLPEGADPKDYIKEAED